MITELTVEYLPNELIHREKQTSEIMNVFETFKKYGLGSNLLIQGVTGSGKTTVVKYLIQKENNTLYSSGASTKTALKTLKSLFDLKSTTTDRLINDAIDSLKNNPRILIIDETNQIRDVSVLFDSLNTIFRATACPIIVISNKRTILNDMANDARLTLLFERIDFPAYNALELYDIVMNRIKQINLAFIDIPEGNLRKICAIAGKEGSARLAISLTLKCLMANNFSEEYIDKVRYTLEKAEWNDFLSDLMPSEREFLWVLLRLCEEKTEIHSAEIIYELNKYTPARVSQLISTFEDYGILTSFHVNTGRRGGRARIVRFVSPEIYEKLNSTIEHDTKTNLF